MNYFVIGFLIGAIFGAALVLIIGQIRQKADKAGMRDAFQALAAEALDSNSQRLVSQAAAALESKKELIDQAIKAVNERLEHVRGYLQSVESSRKQDFGELDKSLRTLSQTTGELHRMLASTQRRGAWGERMAEDILRLAGMTEGVNYAKQDSRYATGSDRPDFTFFLPNDLKVNMDVKFPLEAYKAYLDAESDDAIQAARKQLVSDLTSHIRAVSSRGYVDKKIPTVDYVILFVPSEQVYALALESGPDLIDQGLSRKVVLASPLTLYAMLAVIRQAAESANLMRAADEVMNLLHEFDRQWQKYNEEIDRLGGQLDTVARTYENIRTTRTNMLRKPLDKLEDLRQRRDLPQEPR